MATSLVPCGVTQPAATTAAPETYVEKDERFPTPGDRLNRCVEGLLHRLTFTGLQVLLLAFTSHENPAQ